MFKYEQPHTDMKQLFNHERDCFKMTELIKSYLDTARVLKERIELLSKMLKKEQDLEKHKALEARKDLLEEERYDMLGVVAEMMEHCDERKAVSGGC